MSITLTRYPDWHPQRGAIIVSDEEAAAVAAEAQQRAAAAAQVASDPALPEPPRRGVTPPEGSRFTVREDPAARPVAPDAPPVAAPVAPDARRPLRQRAQEASGAPRESVAVAAGAALLLLVFAAVMALLRLGSAAPAAPAPTAAAPAPTFPPAATSAPTSTALPPDVTARAVVGWFDFTDPATAVPIERLTRFRVLGRAGSQRVLLELESGARVWVVAEDLDLRIDPTLPDLAPVPTPVPAPPPPAQRPVAQQPAPPPACTRVTVVRDVFDDNGMQLGVSEAGGCSQAEAEAAVQQQAAAMVAAWRARQP